MNDLPRWKKVDFPKDLRNLEPGKYCLASPRKATAILRKLGCSLPTFGYERSLGDGLWITSAASGEGYEFRRYENKEGPQ